MITFNSPLSTLLFQPGLHFKDTIYRKTPPPQATMPQTTSPGIWVSVTSSQIPF
jgi:hypothetical protein